MSAVLRFLSYVRQGMARSIAEEADAAGVPTVASATLDVTVEAVGEPIVRTLGVRGPGSVLGLAPGEVLRTDPPDGAADHPPNTFPSVELRTADLPWLFTAARPNDLKLMPWLVLVVVEARAGVSLTSAATPAPVLSLDDAGRELPRLREAWAWAHAQANAEYSDLATLLEQSPEVVSARLVCARFLEPDTPYIACLVPSFEAGRLAGLGRDYAPDSVALTWTNETAAIDLPVYHSWSFRTSVQAADFEELVRRLTPRPLGADVGVRALDISDPGSSRLPHTPAEVGFQGALESPEVAVPPWKDPARSQFQSALAELLADATPGEERPAGAAYDAARHDPAIAPPRYGTLPAGVDVIPDPGARPSAAAPRWLSEANLDPAHRGAAGLGAEVVRRNQEGLMATAWDQAQGVARVNSVLSRTRLALEVGLRAQARLTGVAAGALLQLTAGAHARLASDRSGLTVRGRLHGGTLPSGLVSAAFRRLTRVGGTVAKALTDTGGADAEVTGRMTERFARDAVGMLDHATLTVPFGSVFAPGETPAGVVITGELEPIDFGDLPAADRARIEAAIARSDLATRLLERGGERATGSRFRRAGDAHAPAAETPPAPAARPTATGGQTTATQVDPVALAEAIHDSMTAVQAEVRKVNSVFGAVEHAVSGLGIGLAGTASDAVEPTALARAVATQMDPTAVLAARLRHVIEPAAALGAEPVPASIWVSPELRDPLYRMLVQIDPELLMPGIGALPNDTVGLAVINQAFVEAFLLGANDELTREMIWREYPADLTDTWLRTFWDTRGVTGADGEPIEDILAVADWKPQALGTHATAAMDPSSVLVLVLVIKGDLPRRYPGTLITAVPAHWVERDGATVREEDRAGPALAPLFVGALGRDAVFLGFQFDAAIDVTGTADPADERPGWYFAFEQPPTEPSFGVDTPASDDSTALEYWKDLTWADARRSDADTHVALGALEGTTLPYDERGANTWPETWADSAAAMARITLQRPVRMLVHADQMLEVDDEG